MMSAIPEPWRVSQIAQVDSLYDVRDSGVKRLLSTHPDLIPELVDVARNVSRYFGLDARLALETVIDPEDDAPDEELYAVISPTMGPTQAPERLNAFDEGWWLDRSRRLGARLTVTLDSDDCLANRTTPERAVVKCRNPHFTTPTAKS